MRSSKKAICFLKNLFQGYYLVSAYRTKNLWFFEHNEPSDIAPSNNNEWMCDQQLSLAAPGLDLNAFRARKTYSTKGFWWASVPENVRALDWATNVVSKISL